MENASKALLMAGGILVGMLILALLVTLVSSARELTSRYDTEKKIEAVEQFNTNFLKYIGKQDLTIYQVITITNFAQENNVTIDGGIASTEIKETNIKSKYALHIVSYNQEGYVQSIRIQKISE